MSDVTVDGQGPQVAFVRVLGPVQIVMSDGTTRDLPSASQRRLLALLACEGGQPIRSERLADQLDMSPGSLRTSISRLRKLTGDDVLRTDAVGYRLVADVDGQLFQRALNQTEGDTDRGAQLESALRWWTGPALEEFREEPWARPESARLTELHAAAVEEHAGELLAREQWPQAVASLERHIALHPLRDNARGLLMRALAGAGRQAEALAVYRTYRAYLAEEVGTEPSAYVREIGRDIAEGVAPAPTLSPDLPRYRSSLVGRDDDLAALTDLAGSTRLLTLSGVGGVGKTRLAIALAHSENEAGRTVWFIELAPLHDPANLVSSIETAVGASPTGDALALAAYLGERSGLLMLDNCEHVLDEVAGIVDALTRHCTGITVVTTSREFLALEGEHVFQVRPLDPAGAGADLLLARARAAGTEIAPVDRMVAEEICRRLDGLPLAIEIVATRAAALGPRLLLSSLEDRFTLLAAGHRRGTTRQQTLGRAIDWSYRLLKPHEQRLFRLLGVFSGGFELDAAADVADRVGLPEKEIPLLVGSLAARSMVDVNLRPTVTRYRILEPLRAFALEALQETGELETVARAHADWIAGLTDVPMEGLYSRLCHDGAVRLERELDNWRAALALAQERADPDLAGRLCGAATSILLLSHPQLADAVIRLDPLLAGDDERRSAIASAYGSRAISTMSGADMDRALAVYAECDPSGRLGARQLVHSGYLMVAAGDAGAALGMLDEAIADPAAPPQTVDYMVTIAIFIACAVGRRDLLRDGWLLRARGTAEDSDVPATRLLSRRVLASAMVLTDPAESRAWTRRALEVHETLPLLERRIALGMWSVLWDSQTPALAAQQMRELLVEHIERGHRDDPSLLVAPAVLLARCGHPNADDVIATVVKAAGQGLLRHSLPEVAAYAARGKQLTTDELRSRLLEGLTHLAEIGP